MSSRLLQIFEAYKHHFRTKTRDSSEHGMTMLKGYLLLEQGRNYVTIAQKVKGYTEDGQDLQHFMSDSPWSTEGLFGQVRQDIVHRLHLGGGMLNFDESGVESSGRHKVGAARQYLGREGKTDLGQVGVLSSYYKDGVWLKNPLDTMDEKGNIAQSVQQLAQSQTFESINVRQSERGTLRYEHAFVPVWTKDADNDKTFTQEMLIIRKENDGTCSYALSNGLQKDHLTLAQWRANRYFVERTIQECKSELGFDELQALKYRAYMHTLALCALALVFLADTKLEQRGLYKPQVTVQNELKIPQLPDLSLANVKELLKTAFPLPQLSKQQAVDLVINTLFIRTKNTKSKEIRRGP